MFIKMAILIMLSLTEGHQKIISHSDSSDEEGTEENTRRREPERQWHYEGMPIQYYTRRFVEVTPNPTTIVTDPVTLKPMEPPLSRRFRRIYNPDETATISEFPFMAALLVNKQLWCGGAIIATDLILTAAHCLQLQYNNRFFREYVKMLSVRVGSSNATAGGELFRVLEIFFHPNYKPDTLQFNVAVLRLHKKITAKDDMEVNKIGFSDHRNIATDNDILFVGWGSILSIGGSGGQVLLQKLSLPIYDFADCQDIYGRDIVTKLNFCAGYISLAKNVCNHDAGGPAIRDGSMVGILSFSAKRCDQHDRPAVFFSIGQVANWLESIVKKETSTGNTANKIYGQEN